MYFYLANQTGQNDINGVAFLVWKTATDYTSQVVPRRLELLGTTVAVTSQKNKIMA